LSKTERKNVRNPAEKRVKKAGKQADKIIKEKNKKINKKSFEKSPKYVYNRYGGCNSSP